MALQDRPTVDQKHNLKHENRLLCGHRGDIACIMNTVKPPDNGHAQDPALAFCEAVLFQR